MDYYLRIQTVMAGHSSQVPMVISNCLDALENFIKTTISAQESIVNSFIKYKKIYRFSKSVEVEKKRLIFKTNKSKKLRGPSLWLSLALTFSR